MNTDKPYSQEDYKKAKMQGFDLDNWNDYKEFYELGSDEESEYKANYRKEIL